MNLLAGKRGLSRFVGIFAILIAGSGLFLGHDQAEAATASVAISNFAFTPASQTVTVGDTVTWTNNGAAPHTVTSDTGTTLDSGNMATNATYSKVFTAAGTYPYHCAIHPAMVASVIVAAQATATATATATTTATATATTTATATATATPTAAPTAAPTTAPSAPQGPLQPETAPINITLRGSNEVPPVTTGVASGNFRATPGGSSLAFTLTVSGAGVTAGHIHLGAAGTNGPVIAFLFGPNAAGTNAITQSATITEANFVGPMAGKTWADFTAALNSGQLYVNVHSLGNPGGEIRAQIPGSGAAPGAPKTGNTVAENGSGAMLLFAAFGIAGLIMLSAGSAVALRRRD